MLSISISTDVQLQAKYLCFIAKSVQLDKFAHDNYLVLPTLIPKYPKIVHFPDLGYSTKFWKSLTKLNDYSLTTPYPQLALEEATQLLQNSPHNDNTKLRHQWLKQQSEFQMALASVLSQQLLNSIESITVLLTGLGTRSSFSTGKTKDHKSFLICTSRTDLPIQNINRAILKGIISLTQSEYSDLGTIGYHKRNGVSEFLNHHTTLTPFLTYKENLQPDPKLVRQSQQYLKQLGFPTNHDFDLDTFIQQLRPLETNLFLHLWENAGILVTFDQAAQAVWGDQAEDKYSLFMLAKLIESLRHKLLTFGIQKHMIQTLRKQGYLLIK